MALRLGDQAPNLLARRSRPLDLNLRDEGRVILSDPKADRNALGGHGVAS